MRDDHWLEISDLSIFDAAYWMQVSADPRWHHSLWEPDDIKAERELEAFNNMSGGAEDVYEKCGLLLSAVRAGKIIATENPALDPNSHFTNIKIDKESWLEWCRANGYSKTSMNFPVRSGRLARSTTNASGTDTNSPPDWRDAARDIADELFDHDTNCSTRDSLKNYSNRVMAVMQERAIRGPRGIIDNPATIQREALQGSNWWATKEK